MDQFESFETKRFVQRLLGKVRGSKRTGCCTFLLGAWPLPRAAALEMGHELLSERCKVCTFSQQHYSCICWGPW
jgi:hypothetical protein